MKEIAGPKISVSGKWERHEIVRHVVNTFIDAEHAAKGPRIRFIYPVETLSTNEDLHISRPGKKKNFDFKVDVTEEMGLGRGKHDEIIQLSGSTPYCMTIS